MVNGGPTMRLREAGYREQAFAKAWLLIRGRFDLWPDALDMMLFDSHLDVLLFVPDAGLEPGGDDLPGRARVRWEGSRSVEVLVAHGHTDEDVPAKHPVPGAGEPSIIECAPRSKADADYLEDIVSAYLSAPEGSDEEELLGKAHALACERLGVDQMTHIEVSSARDAAPEPSGRIATDPATRSRHRLGCPAIGGRGACCCWDW